MRKSDRVILGKDCVYSTNCDVTGLNNNVIVCGGSGTGKTMSISEPRMIETKNSSLIATVTKRRIVEKYKPMFQRRGYEILDLNFADPEMSTAGYDPLAYVKTPREITFLANTLVNVDPDHTTAADPFWDEAAVSLLSAEIAYAMAVKEDADFSDVLETNRLVGTLMDYNLVYSYQDGDSTIEKGFRKSKKREIAEFGHSCWQTFRRCPEKTANCIYTSLNTALDKVFDPQIAVMMKRRPRVNFETLGMHKTVLFVTTSPVNLTLQRFMNLFYADAIRQLFESAEKMNDGVLRVPVHILCDDFATGGKIPDFQDYISIFREKRISVTLLLQSESQLQSMYGVYESSTIINNCDSYVYLGGMDLDTARSVSLRMNFPLDEVAYMPIGQVMLFRRGQRPIVTERYDVRADSRYKKITKEYEDAIAAQKVREKENRDKKYWTYHPENSDAERRGSRTPFKGVSG